MASFIERRGVGETVPIGNPVKHQTPLVQARRRIPKEVVQQNLGLVGNKLNVKKFETHIIELEAFAFIQGPAGVSDKRLTQE